ncbi:MAG: hypothetical protein OSA98_25800 [Rubripirellula sp.]|nr:hypothetical protein [Rubripirellula sp.]
MTTASATSIPVWSHGGDDYLTLTDPNNLDAMSLEGMFGSMARTDLNTGEGRNVLPDPSPDAAPPDAAASDPSVRQAVVDLCPSNAIIFLRAAS